VHRAGYRKRLLLRDAPYIQTGDSAECGKASATCCEQDSFYMARSKQNFLDTSTWEQIIRVLEQSDESDAEPGSQQGMTTLTQPDRK
jgi:hypothetical protein